MMDGPKRNLTARATQVREIARTAGKLAAEEAMTWDVFRWTVVALLVANLFLSLILYSGIKSEIATMEQDRAAYTSQLTTLRADVDTQIAEAKAGLTQDLAAMQSDLKEQLRKAMATLSRPTPQRATEPHPVPMPTKSPRH